MAHGALPCVVCAGHRHCVPGDPLLDRAGRHSAGAVSGRQEGAENGGLRAVGHLCFLFCVYVILILLIFLIFSVYKFKELQDKVTNINGIINKFFFICYYLQ